MVVISWISGPMALSGSGFENYMIQIATRFLIKLDYPMKVSFKPLKSFQFIGRVHLVPRSVSDVVKDGYLEELE